MHGRFPLAVSYVTEKRSSVRGEGALLAASGIALSESGHYAGTIFMLMSTDRAECVSEPTEM